MASNPERKMANIGTSPESLDLLPSALLATIFTKLDVSSICSVAATCKTFNSCASQILSFLPNFHLLDVAPSRELLSPLMPPNPSMRCLKLDCGRLDDAAIELLAHPNLDELCLHNCADFSGKLLSEIGGRCKDLKSLYLGSVAEKRGRAVQLSDLEELLSGCSQLEALVLMFDLSSLIRHSFAPLCALASERLTSLEIGHIASGMVRDLVSPYLPSNHIQPSKLPRIQKLCLSVEFITDAMVRAISQGLTSLTHLDLRDEPIAEPPIMIDFTNSGLQEINPHGKLKHLSLVRSQKFVNTYFRRVNDLGFLSMAGRCRSMESICLVGFCSVTDTGFKTLFHSCSNLYKVSVCHGRQLTDLAFHDISATSLSLTHVCLTRCDLLTNHAVANLASNKNLKVLDLRDCRKLGDESLQAIATLPTLERLLLDGSDITDTGLSHLKGMINSLVSLSLRRCKRLTDKCIPALFDGSSKLELLELDLSNIPSLSDNVVLSLTKWRVPLLELRMRQCPLIGDASVMALASTDGSALQLLDLYDCRGITQLSFKWLKKPYFPRLRWLGVSGSVNRDIVDALAMNRPSLRVACRGEELGTDRWDTVADEDLDDYDEMDEIENWMDVDDEYDEWGL